MLKVWAPKPQKWALGHNCKQLSALPCKESLPLENSTRKPSHVDPPDYLPTGAGHLPLIWKSGYKPRGAVI